MITLDNDSLAFRFPDVHDEAKCEIEFQRTLRLPDDDKTYPLPAGLGRFPVRHIDDFAERLPTPLTKRGGVVMPMWQAEAMWMNFGGRWGGGYPFAVKVATGKINALTGEAWRPGLHRDPQDYLVLPDQPWLDGYCVEKGTIRQFVAAPLGSGITAEEQITGEAEYGGLQIIAYPMKRSAYENLMRVQASVRRSQLLVDENRAPMGLAPGGKMRQEIYDDPHAFDVWDLRNPARCFVTILDAVSWREVTGEKPPTEPISADEYRSAGIPWFDYYAADKKALEGSSALGALKTVAKASDFGLTGKQWGNGAAVSPEAIVNVGPSSRAVRQSDQVSEAEW